MQPFKLVLLSALLSTAEMAIASGGPKLMNVTSGCDVYGEGKIIQYIGGDTTLSVSEASSIFNFYNLIQASNGKIYCIGINLNTAPNQQRAIFEYDHQTGTLSSPILLTINSYGTPLYVSGKLLEASNGKLYGVSNNGGPNNNPTIFSYNIGADSVVILDTFPSGINYLFNGMIQSSNGKLYGLSNNDGTNQGGTIYQYDIATNSISMLVSLPANADPAGPLVEAGADTLYGMTYGDGLNGRGTIFCYVIGTGAYDTLYNVPGPNTCDAGTLILASDGKLYGTMSDNYVAGVHYYGNLFSFDRYSNTYTDLYDVTNSDLFYGGGVPGSLFQASDGMIYSLMTGYGSHGWSGSIFRFSINTDSLTTEVLLDSSTTGVNPGTFIEYYPWLGTGIYPMPESTAKIYGKKGAIVIERPDATPATVIVTNLLGQQVINTHTNSTSLTIPLEATEGIYIVQVTEGGNQTAKKVFVR